MSVTRMASLTGEKMWSHGALMIDPLLDQVSESNEDAGKT